MSNILVTDKNHYGFNFPERMPQPQIELFGYALTRGRYGKHLQGKLLEANGMTLSDFKFLSPFEHLMNFVKLAWPTEVVIESRGYVNKGMLRIWETLCEEDDIGIAGAAGLSKSFGVAAWVVVDWMAAPDVTSTFTASTTFEAQEQRIWGHVSKLWKSAKYRVGTYLDYKRSIVMERVDPKDKNAMERDYINSIKALAFPKGSEGRAAVDTTRGRHNMRVRMIVDELAEMEMYVNKVRGNLAANLDFMYVGIANPMAGENPHRELCEPDHPRKWDSISPDVPKWKTRTGVAIFLHGEKDSPNMASPPDEPPPFPFLPTRESLAAILKNEYGNRNSMGYLRNAIGHWPTDVVQTTVISRSNISASNISYEPLWTGDKLWLATLDCAQTAEGDRNILTFGFLGKIREDGTKVLMFKGQKGYSVSVGEEFETSLARQVVDDLEKMGIRPENFGMDVSGDGGKIMSAIIREWMPRNSSAHRIVAISSSGKPTERPASPKDSRPAREVYDRLVTEYNFALYHAICSRLIFGIKLGDTDEELISEMCMREYRMKGGKMSVETKKEMKSRIGKSPDKLDSINMFVEIARRRGLRFIANDKKPDRRNEVLERFYKKEVESEEYAGASFDPDGF